MENQSPKLTYLVQFDCKHTLNFSAPCPQLGDVLWCQRCRAERTINIAVNEYKIRCTVCALSRKFGTAKLEATVAVARHRMKFPDHIVDLYNGRKKIDTVGGRNPTVTLMLPESDSPLAS